MSEKYIIHVNYKQVPISNRTRSINYEHIPILFVHKKNFMEEFIANCGRWIDVPAILMPANKNIRFLIKLYQNSLTSAYIVFVLDSKVNALIPILDTVSSAVTGTQLVLVLQNSTCLSFTIVLDSVFISNMIHTQICLCSYLAKHSLFTPKIFNSFFMENFSEKVKSVQLTPTILPLMPFSDSNEALLTWKKRNMVTNSNFYMKKSKIKITFFTWNVEQKLPEQWTSKEISFIFAKNSDIVYIALEEIDFSAHAIIFGDSNRCECWHKVLSDAASWYDYEPLGEEQLGGVFVIAFKRKDTQFTIKYQNLFSMRLGVNGLTANKSAVVSHLIVDNSHFAVIGAHLEAHTESLSIRNEQFKSILKKIDDKQMDYIIIFGDLNYRIDNQFQETVDLIKEKKIDELKKFDQLKQVQESDEIIGQFYESEINFNPTFKFDDYSNIYDSSPKHRTPSWTDRVLIKTNHPKYWTGLTDETFFETNAIQNLCYENCELKLNEIASLRHPDKPDYPSKPECSTYKSFDVQFSDHRPVVAEYFFDIVTIDENRFNNFKEIQEKQLNLINGLSEAKVTIDKKLIHIKPGETNTITLKNGKNAIGQWSPGVMPEFVSIIPPNGIILPGSEVQILIETKEEILEPTLCSIDIYGGSPVFFEITSNE